MIFTKQKENAALLLEAFWRMISFQPSDSQTLKTNIMR